MRQAQPGEHFEAVLVTKTVERFARALGAGGFHSAAGAAGSSTALVAAAVAKRAGRMVVLVVAHLDDADEAAEELQAAGIDASRFPALELLPGESSVSLDLFAERVALQRRFAKGAGKEDGAGQVLICPIQALMQNVPAPDKLDDLSLTLRAASAVGFDRIVRWLDSAGYSRTDAVSEPGDFAVRGGILDIFPPSGGAPVRLDFFGDDIESISEIDLDTMGSDRKVKEVELVGANLSAIMDDDASGRSGVNLLELLSPRCIAIVSETMEVTEQGRGYYERVTDARGISGPPAVFRLLRERFHAFAEVNQFSGSSSGVAGVIELPAGMLREFSRDAGEAVRELGEMTADHRVLVLCQNAGEQQRLGELAEEFASGKKIESAVVYLHRGFVWRGEEGGLPLAVVPYSELLHRYQTRRRIRRLRGRAGKAADTFIDLEVGDYVVHTDHGIAQFIGLKLMKPHAGQTLPEPGRVTEPLRPGVGKKGAKGKPAPVGGGATGGAAQQKAPTGGGLEEEFLTLEFAGRAKLHVPVSQIDRVQKYIGGFHGKPPLSTIGGKRWQSQKEQVKESVKDLAAELLRVQAAREHMPGIRYPADTAWQKEFEAEFPYTETDDQLASLAEIKKDMTTEQPMDRLLCGDVGYGKTELAIRAAFKAVEYGKQVAVLVPTTILAEQHERTFKSRFADYPFRVESISRFKTTQESNAILAAARKGQVDILIGTHRLLSKDVRFADLGLVVIDEEQRFGVEHKNALLGLRMTADVLTLSATPIPRTLHMAMLGLRDISSLSTAPMDRRAVVTEIAPYNEKRIKQAIERELAREGQVYFVHNRVHNIKSVADDIQKLAPDARIIIGHGQMPDDELERVMHAFIRREADILVSTTIIESGIDIPTANTMFINMADRFGLAELHQLRGRVGRYKHRAYCYLLLPPDRPLTDIAAKRLRAIEEFSMLGAGFKIAMRDLEIRGAGNLLGAEQSGHIAAVGYDMYCQLLEQATHELKQEPTSAPSDTTIEIGINGSLPKAYIASDARRLEAYRRIASARTHEELAGAEHDLRDAYGELPKVSQRLFDLAALRIAAQRATVRSIAVHEQDVIIRCEDADGVARILEGVKGTVRVLSPKGPKELREVYFRPPPSFLEPESLLFVLRRRFVGERAGSGAATAVREAQPTRSR